eukprot:gnl/TRDRNA2_/TRDRNA2_161534_c0_seq1.p1 gnl/TRDRNA2_/TRDRNA2_161534_c0~~gnl/TRDRNA2_/TRDRNA2_161534_c0_seq1.p1  ORF type:complete len:189 (-),score=13.57 gnl/TRDRNA2_/TRDRNA2_161534_c0_seq1:51-617(-)
MSAQRRVREFKPLETANMAWALAVAVQSGATLFAALTRAAEQRLEDFNAEALSMTLWALSRCRSLRNAWNLHRLAESTIPRCFGVLLTECEQRGTFAHEIAHLMGLKGLKCAAGTRGAESCFAVATTCVAVMRLKHQDETVPHNLQLRSRRSHESADSAIVCVWCVCCEPSSQGPWLGQTTAMPWPKA